MVATVKTLTYTGTTQTITIPAGTVSVDMYLWGGAGGGGGSDAGGPGGYGAAGHYVYKTGYSVTPLETITVGVGGGGAGGGSGGGAPGGRNGKSLTGYSGGRGGNAGPTPYSGSGGAGGGASVIQIQGVDVAIAGGGGGGAGAGKGSNGTSGINSNTATANSPGTLGENGADHSGDGAGGGGAGGGADGGTGGNGGSGDNGGTGGYSGSNLIPAGGNGGNGTGTAPEGTAVSYYQSGVAVGASPSSVGGNGLVVLIFNIEAGSKYKVSGEWKDITDVYTKVSGVWKQVTAAYTKVSGTWKAIFNSGITVLSTAAGFGDTEGSSSSGTPGSGGGGGGRVICTWLQQRGLFSAEDLAVDTEYSVKYISRRTKIGYWFWAVPLVHYMTRAERNDNKFGKLVIRVIRALAQARANELGYAMGVKKGRDPLGILTRLIGESFCWTVGLVVQPFVEQRFAKWLEIYDPQKG